MLPHNWSTSSRVWATRAVLPRPPVDPANISPITAPTRARPRHSRAEENRYGREWGSLSLRKISHRLDDTERISSRAFSSMALRPVKALTTKGT